MADLKSAAPATPEQMYWEYEARAALFGEGKLITFDGGSCSDIGTQLTEADKVEVDIGDHSVEFYQDVAATLKRIRQELKNDEHAN